MCHSRNMQPKLINFYNPCRNLNIETLQTIAGTAHRREVWCGDFNAHNSLWGSSQTDSNGDVVEEMLEERSLFCLNDGQKTRIDVNRGTQSCLDLTLVTDSLVKSCECKR